MASAAVLTLFLMPVLIRICRRKDWSASRYLIPLSYASILGSTCTIIGTSTLLTITATASKHCQISI